MENSQGGFFTEVSDGKKDSGGLAFGGLTYDQLLIVNMRGVSGVLPDIADRLGCSVEDLLSERTTKIADLLGFEIGLICL